MYDYKLKKLPKNTFEILLKVFKKTVKDNYQKAFEKLRQKLAVKGFREGKVPASIAEKHIAKQSVYQELIRQLLPDIYQEILVKEKLQPIVNPRIEIVKSKEDQDWEIKITLAIKPSVDIAGYKSVIADIKKNAKAGDIWTPGKDKQPDKDTEKNKQKLLNGILTGLLQKMKVEIADMVIADELNRRLTQLLDDIKKVGLTVDAYFNSKKTTMDEIKKQYTKEITDTYRLEFILQEIADKEGISVEKEDLNKLFSTIKDENERKLAEQNGYFYASILRKQKTLDFLLGL